MNAATSSTRGCKDDPHILRDMAQVRRDEMKAAQEILGVEHTWLGFVDSGLPEGDPLPPLPDGLLRRWSRSR